MIYLISVWYFVLFFLTKDLNSFHIQYAMGMFLLAAYLAQYFYKKINPLLGISYLYFALNSIRLISFPQVYWRTFEIPAIIGFEALVTAGFLYLTIISVVFALLRDEEMHFLKKLYMWLAITNAVVYIPRLFMKDQNYFLFNNASIDAAFLSCCLPLIWEYLTKLNSKPIAWALFAFIASPCILTFTSAGILGLGLSMSAYFWAVNKFQRKHFWAGVYLAGTVATVGWLAQGENLVNSSGRMHIWKLSMSYWWENVNRMWGTGVGTFQMIGPGLQVAEHTLTKSKDPIAGFFWLHSDVLQVLFETGFVGLFLVVLVCGVALFKLRKSPSLFAGFATYLATATFNMPLRHIVFTCLGATFLIFAFRPPIESRT